MIPLLLLFIALAFPWTPLGANPAALELPGRALAADPSPPLQATGEKGLFSVELLPPPGGLAVGRNDLALRVLDEGGSPVEGAGINVLPLLHRHGEGSGVRPRVAESGKGVYRVENVYLSMKGHWDLRVTVRKGPLEDQAVFSFPGVDRRLPPPKD